MMYRRWICVGAVCLVIATAWSGCGTSEDDGEYARPRDTGQARTHGVTLVEQGKLAYATYCIGCHGEKGDGNGESAKFYSPRPRNFTLGEFKFSSTRSGELPTDDDLRRTIRNGLRGSAMPPFDRIQETTIDALIAYLKTFSPKWSENAPAKSIPFVNDPYFGDEDLSAAISRGELIYHGYATCWTCHPSYVSGEKINEYRRAINAQAYDAFREHMDDSVGKENTQGELIYPPDFRRDFVRSGMNVKDIYRSVAAGITGTAMPTWVDSMELPNPTAGEAPLVEPADLWAVAYYVQHLIKQRPVKLQSGEFVLRGRKREIYLHGEPPKSTAAPTKEEDTQTEPADFGF